VVGVSLCGFEMDEAVASQEYGGKVRGSSSSKNSIGRVGVIRFSAVGDVVLTSPAVAALKRAWPHVEIVYVTSVKNRALVANDPNISSVFTLDDGERVIDFSNRVKALELDHVLDLHGSLRSRAVCALIGCKTVRWRKRSLWDEATVRVGLRRWQSPSTVCHRYHDAVERLVGSKLALEPLRMHLSEDQRARGEALICDFGLDQSKPIVGMNPGAGWETKRWPVRYFSDLARRVLSTGVQVLVSGSCEEQSLCEELVRLAPGAVYISADLGSWAGVISHCDAFVANDCGPMHMARALGVPTLAVFGSTDPYQFDFEGHYVYSNNQSCAPCHFYGRRRCPKRHFRCLSVLTSEAAWPALRRLLDTPNGLVVKG